MYYLDLDRNPIFRIRPAFFVRVNGYSLDPNNRIISQSVLEKNYHVRTRLESKSGLLTTIDVNIFQPWSEMLWLYL